MATSSPDVYIPPYVDLPASLVQHSNGLSIDFGGSVIKVAYRPKDKTLKSGEPPVASGKERIRLMSFSRPEISTALQQIAGLANIRRASPSEPSLVNTTGIGSNEFSDQIEQILRVSTKNLTEFDCFVNSFKEMCKSLTKNEIVHPMHPEGEREGRKMVASVMGMVHKLKEHSEQDDSFVDPNAQKGAQQSSKGVSPLAEEDKELFPCLILMLGSGFGVMKIEESGKFTLVDGSNSGGRSFLGLGNLLTGADTYGELIELASRGIDRNVNTYAGDFQVDSGKDDMYSAANEAGDVITFTFGKATKGKLSDFRKEDIARALVVQYALNTSQLAHASAALHGCKNVFYCGNFASGDVIRRELTKYQIYHSVFPLSKTAIHYHFLKHGGFMGAIGAFIAPNLPNSEK